MTHLNHTKNRYLELDALRGFAALFVLFFHYTMLHKELPIYAVSRYGITGVDLFFMISGFVIYQSINVANSGLEFLINRLTRIYPTYWTAISFTFLVIILTHVVILKTDQPIIWREYLYNLTMFQLYANVPDLDGPYWTMIIEMLFYLVIFVLFICSLLRFTIPIIVLLILLSEIVTEFYKGYGGEFYYDYLINFPLFQFLPLFLAGIVFYKITVEHTRKWRFYLLIAGCYLAQILMYKHGGRSSGFISHLEYKAAITVYFVLFILFASGKLKWMVSPVTLFLGKISFPLYLIHQWVSLYCIVPLLTKSGVNYYIASYLIALPFCILIASLITFTVERRFSPFLRKRLTFFMLERLPERLNESILYRKLKRIVGYL